MKTRPTTEIKPACADLLEPVEVKFQLITVCVTTADLNRFFAVNHSTKRAVETWLELVTLISQPPFTDPLWN